MKKLLLSIFLAAPILAQAATTGVALNTNTLLVVNPPAAQFWPSNATAILSAIGASTISNNIRLTVGLDATNHANAILQSATNYANAVTNSASVTNWINSRQPASDNLTNWSNIPTGAMANVVSTTFLTNWANAVSNLTTAVTNSASVTNWIASRQPADAVLTNLVGTVGKNVTNSANGWGMGSTLSSGTLTESISNSVTLIASNATTAQLDFTTTPDYMSTDVMRANLSLQLTNVVFGRSVSIWLTGDTNANNRTVTVSTNGMTGNWQVHWNFNSPTNGSSDFTVTNNMRAELQIKATKQDGLGTNHLWAIWGVVR